MIFEPGTKVTTTDLDGKLTGIVLECINANEPEDVKIQGLRYYVVANGYVWSVPSDRLQATGTATPETLEALKSRACNYLNSGSQFSELAPRIDANALTHIRVALKNKNLTIDQSTHSDLLLVSSQQKLSNFINDTLGGYFPCRLGKGEIAFHVTLDQANELIEAWGNR